MLTSDMLFARLQPFLIAFFTFVAFSITLVANHGKRNAQRVPLAIMGCVVWEKFFFYCLSAQGLIDPAVVKYFQYTVACPLIIYAMLHVTNSVTTFSVALHAGLVVPMLLTFYLAFTTDSMCFWFVASWLVTLPTLYCGLYVYPKNAASPEAADLGKSITLFYAALSLPLGFFPLGGPLALNFIDAASERFAICVADHFITSGGVLLMGLAPTRQERSADACLA